MKFSQARECYRSFENSGMYILLLMVQDQVMIISGTEASRPMSAEPPYQQIFDRLDVTNPEHAEYYLPMFGYSPGGTPSVSSVTLSDSRSDLEDLSDVSITFVFLM